MLVDSHHKGFKKSVLQNKNKANNYKRKLSPNNYDVFLGGACNPTTWRRDTAIPFFEKQGISYYNPQVEVWSDDLIEKERIAKKNSKILFFVFDPNCSRGLASFVEVAYLAGCRRKLVIVRPNIQNWTPPIICGEVISETESTQILNAFHCLDSMAYSNMSFFVDIQEALCYIKNELSNTFENHLKRSSTLQYCVSSQSAEDTCRKCDKIGFPWHDCITTYRFIGISSPLKPCCSAKTVVGKLKAFSIDFFIGGSTPCVTDVTAQYLKKNGEKTFVQSLSDHSHSFLFDREIQNRCRTLIFCIPCNSLQLVTQIEAAYAIGQGKTVHVFIDSIPVSSIASNKNRVSTKRTGRIEKQKPTSAPNTPTDTTILPPLFCPDSGNGSMDEMAIGEMSGLPPMSERGLADHNRSRAYLISVAKEMQCPVDANITNPILIYF